MVSLARRTEKESMVRIDEGSVRGHVAQVVRSSVAETLDGRFDSAAAA